MTSAIRLHVLARAFKIKKSPMKIASNGIRINIEEQGLGELSLVFLHYYGGSARVWRKVIAALRNRTTPLQSTRRLGQIRRAPERL